MSEWRCCTLIVKQYPELESWNGHSLNNGYLVAGGQLLNPISRGAETVMGISVKSADDMIIADATIAGPGVFDQAHGVAAHGIMGDFDSAQAQIGPYCLEVMAFRVAFAGDKNERVCWAVSGRR